MVVQKTEPEVGGAWAVCNQESLTKLTPQELKEIKSFEGGWKLGLFGSLVSAMRIEKALENLGLIHPPILTALLNPHSKGPYTPTAAYLSEKSLVAQLSCNANNSQVLAIRASLTEDSSELTLIQGPPVIFQAIHLISIGNWQDKNYVYGDGRVVGARQEIPLHRPNQRSGKEWLEFTYFHG
jgi:hypothetical protein